MNRHNARHARPGGRRNRKIVTSAITSLALLGGASPALASETHPSPELVKRVEMIHKTERNLERKLKTNQEVSFDASHDVYWRRAPRKTADGSLVPPKNTHLLKTEAALKARVNGENRLFRVIFKDLKPDSPIGVRDIDVKVLPKDVLLVPSSVTNGPPAPGSPWPSEIPIETQSATLDLNYTHTGGYASTEVQRADGQAFTIHVGQTKQTNSDGVVL